MKFIIRMRDFAGREPYKEVYSGDKEPFDLSGPDYIKKRLLQRYGPGMFVVKKIDGKEETVFEGEVRGEGYRTWTKEERRKHVFERCYGRREKVIVSSLVILTIILLIYSIYYILQHRLSPILAAVLMVVLFLFTAASVFFLDTVLWEST